MPGNQALRRHRWEDHCKFKASLVDKSKFRGYPGLQSKTLSQKQTQRTVVSVKCSRAYLLALSLGICSLAGGSSRKPKAFTSPVYLSV